MAQAEVLKQNEETSFEAKFFVEGLYLGRKDSAETDMDTYGIYSSDKYYPNSRLNTTDYDPDACELIACKPGGSAIDIQVITTDWVLTNLGGGFFKVTITGASDLLDTLGQGLLYALRPKRYSSTATGAGTVTTLLDDTLNNTPPPFTQDSDLNGWDLEFGTDVSNLGMIRRITAYAQATGTMTFLDLPAATAAADAYDLFHERAFNVTGWVLPVRSYDLNAGNVGAVDGSTAAATRLKLFSEYQDYEMGAVWLDTNNGAAGSTDYENGTKLNACLLFADAITIAVSLNRKHYMILPGSLVTLTQDFDHDIFMGTGWTLAPAGFDLSNCYIHNAFVSGISTSDTQNAFFVGCLMWSAIIGSAVLRECALANDLTLGEAGNYTMNDCYQAHGISASAIDFNFLGGAQVQMDDWHGVIVLKNMAAGDSLSMFGNGRIIIDASCTGGDIETVAGTVAVTDNAAGAVTVTDEAARFSVDRLASATDMATVINYVRGRKVLSKSGPVWSLTVYDHTDDFTPILVKAIKDLNGNDIDDLVAGQLAMELKSSV